MDNDSSLPPVSRVASRATRRIVPLVLVAFFMLVASASAHYVGASTTCTATGNTVTFYWSDFTSGTGNGGENTPTWQILYTPTGGSQITYTGQVTFPGATYTLVVPIEGLAGSLVASSTWTPSQTTDGYSGSQSFDLTVGSCPVSTAIATTASAGSAAGMPMTDTAVLSGGAPAPNAPTGTITFSLYSASDTSCSTALKTVTSTVDGDGSYTSPPVTESTAGAYQWVASYSGDANNTASAEMCGQPSEQTTLVPPPTIVTTPSGSVTAGGSVSDQATLSAGDSPTGTITFKLYGPNDSSCSTAIQTATVPVTTGDGTYSTPSYTLSTAGTYYWTASYSGDAKNPSVSEGCGAEQVVVTPPGTPPCTPGSPGCTPLPCTPGSPGCTPTPCTPGSPGCTPVPCTPPSGSPPSGTPPASCASPTIVTKASPGGPAPFKISDQAVLSGGNAPTGTITFSLYPAGSTCTAALYTSTPVKVSGNGTYSSPVLTETKVGTFQWVASYSGDANNKAVSDGCGQKAEQVTTTKVGPLCTSFHVPLLGRFGQTIYKTFKARVTSLDVKSVTFYLDGKKLKTMTKSHGGFFTITIGLSKVGKGLHTVKARVILKDKSCKPIIKHGSFVHATINHYSSTRKT